MFVLYELIQPGGAQLLQPAALGRAQHVAQELVVVLGAPLLRRDAETQRAVEATAREGQ